MTLADFVEALKDRIDIVDLISEYVELKRAGSQFKALCPFHPEKTPSFFVNPQRQFFHCFGCGAGGDVITFVMKHESLEFMDALEVLAKRAGLSLDVLKPAKGIRPVRDSIIEANTAAMQFYKKTLQQSPQAIAYIKKRGITEKTIEDFQIGYAPPGGDKLIQHLRDRGFNEDIMIRAGLVKKTSDGRLLEVFRQRIVFPILNPKGQVVGFGGRTISDEQLGPKYLNTPETMLFKKSQELFGIYQAKDAIRQKGYVMVTEGYLDVITAHQAGLRNVVAPLGTALTDGHARVIKRYTDKVLLIFDSDEAGINASKRAALVLLVEGLQPKVLLLPHGEDLDSFIKGRGVDELRRLFSSSMAIVDFFVSLKTDRLSNIRVLIEAISKIKDPILRGSMLQELSERSKIPQEMLMEELRKHGSTGRKIQALSKLEMPTAEELLLALVIDYPFLRDRVRDSVSEEMFEDEQLKEIYSKVLASEEEPLHNILTEAEMQRVSSVLVRTQIDAEEVERNIQDSIKKLRTRNIRKRIAQLQGAIEEAERSEPEKVPQLQRNLHALMKEAKSEGLL